MRYLAKAYIVVVLVAFVVLVYEKMKADEYRAGVRACMQTDVQDNCEMKGVYGK